MISHWNICDLVYTEKLKFKIPHWIFCDLVYTENLKEIVVKYIYICQMSLNNENTLDVLKYIANYIIIFLKKIINTQIMIFNLTLILNIIFLHNLLI